MSFEGPLKPWEGPLMFLGAPDELLKSSSRRFGKVWEGLARLGKVWEGPGGAGGLGLQGRAIGVRQVGLLVDGADRVRLVRILKLARVDITSAKCASRRSRSAAGPHSAQ